MKQFISLISISLLIFASITTIQQQVYAGKEDKDYDGDGVTEYRNWDGKMLDDKTYLTRVTYCNEMRFFENPPLIDINTKCRDWVLTYEGESTIIEYIVTKYFPY